METTTNTNTNNHNGTNLQRQQQQSMKEKRQSYIQRFNNGAAMCIETGNYDQAISNLVKALKLVYIEQQQQQQQQQQDYDNDEQQQVACSCSQCNIDACLKMSRRASAHRKLLLKQNSSTNKMTMVQQQQQQQQQQTTVQLKTLSEEEEHEETAVHKEGRYIYKEPLRFPPQMFVSSCRQQYGIEIENNNQAQQQQFQQYELDLDTIHLVVAYNLALANHLRALERQQQGQDSLMIVNQCLTMSLNLYQVAATKLHQITTSTELMMEQRQEQLQVASCCSTNNNNDAAAATLFRTFFSMALCNNLGEIHGTLGNIGMHQTCLQELLGTIMMLLVTVGYKNNNNNNQNNNQNINNQENDNVDPHNVTTSLIDLDGFLQNTTCLVLKDPCAAQA